MRLISKLIIIGIIATSIGAHSQPTWFDDLEVKSTSISGVGTGTGLDEARQQALKSISLSLYSEVSSYTEQTVVTRGDRGELHSRAATKVENHNVPLSLVHWTKQELVDGFYYVKAEMNISEWVNVQEVKLSAKITEIDEMTSIDSWSLSDYRRSQAIALQQHQVIAEIVSPYSMVSSHFSLARASLIKKQNEFASTVCYSVEKSHDKIADKYYLPVLESALRDCQLKVLNHPECLKVTFIASNDRTTSAELKTHFLVNIEGEQSFQLEIKGSGNSYKSALIDVAKNLGVIFKEQGGILPSLKDKM